MKNVNVPSLFISPKTAQRSLEGNPVILCQGKIEAFSPHHPSREAPQLAGSQGQQGGEVF